VHDRILELLRVGESCVKPPCGGREAVQAVEQATAQIHGAAHTLPVGDDERLIAADHPLAHLGSVELSGPGVVGIPVGDAGATIYTAFGEVMPLAHIGAIGLQPARLHEPVVVLFNLFHESIISFLQLWPKKISCECSHH